MENLNIVDIDGIEDIKYLTDKRDVELEHLILLINENKTPILIQNRLSCILRLNKQIKLLEDTLIVNRIVKANQK